MNTDKTLYIHVGLAKTGTTAIQNFLTSHTAWLLEKGISYKVSPKYNSHYDLQEKIRRGLYEQFESYINNQFHSDIHKVIISSEFFPGLLSNIMENCRHLPLIKIIVYLRRQDYWLESLYTQEIKQVDIHGLGSNEIGITKTFKDWLADKFENNSALKWKKFLTFCEKTFGLENIIVKAFEKEQFINHNLIDDFLSIFDLKTPQQIDFFRLESNKSFAFEFIELIRIANKYYPSNVKNLIQLLKKYNIKQPNGMIRIASIETRNRIIDKFKGDNEYIAMKFLKRSNGQLFNSKLPDNNNLCGENYQQDKSFELIIRNYLELILNMEKK